MSETIVGQPFFVRPLHPGMGLAVAERTILRRQPDGSFEGWGDVAKRVALGNTLLMPGGREHVRFEAERDQMERHIAKATLLMSGRHLQHGDETQPTRNLELFSNCATAAMSFIEFALLLNGSGVGRAYDDDLMVVNWDNAPNLRCVISNSHPDFDWGADEDVRDARHKYRGENVMFHEVEDSREGWAKAIEVWEVLAFQKIHRDTTLVLDFSKVRAKGQPIMGMQGRPSSGPKPLMAALMKCASIKGAGMPPWMQTMYVDHYAAECVLVGGARRAARMATKYWKDKGIIDFIQIKRPVEYQDLEMAEVVALRKGMSARKEQAPSPFLWSSNNSVTVDAEFWAAVKSHQAGDRSRPARHAWKVLSALTEAAYGDGTGEPGIINVDKLRQNDKGLTDLSAGDFVGSAKYQVEDDTKLVLSKLAKITRKKRYYMITNPCVTVDTMVMTDEGPRQVADLIGKPFAAIVNGKSHKATGFWSTGVKPVFKVKTERGYSVRATGNHKVLVETDRRRRLDGSFNITQEWKCVEDLCTGDLMVLSNNSKVKVDVSSRDFMLGWALGEIKGDGGHSPDNSGGTYMRFWSSADEELVKLAAECVRELGADDRFQGGSTYSARGGSEVTTVKSVGLAELAAPYLSAGDKGILPALEQQGPAFVAGFLRGFFDADGSVQGDLNKGRSVRLAQSDRPALEAAQRMLARFGIASAIYLRRDAGARMMPDGKGGDALYQHKAQYELVVSKDNIVRFEDKIGFFHPDKASALAELTESSTREPYAERFTSAVMSVEADGEEEVYDCTVDDVHCFDANGLIVHNCGEIALSLLGSYCVIADLVPFHADTLDEAEDAFRVATRALMRVNLMDNLYAAETKRTNRIGVGMTGVHEFAWKFFKVGFKDLVRPDFETFHETFGRYADAEVIELARTADINRAPADAIHGGGRVRAAAFWLTLARFSRAVQDESVAYAAELGVEVPHTVLTQKPAGCASLDTEFKTTEGVMSMRALFEANGISEADLLEMENGTWIEPKVKTLVLDETNTPREVTKLYLNGMKPVYEIAFEDGTIAKLTGNHRLKTLTGWKRVDELTVDDEIVHY